MIGLKTGVFFLSFFSTGRKSFFMGKCIKHPKGGERKGGQGAERGERKEQGGEDAEEAVCV